MNKTEQAIEIIEPVIKAAINTAENDEGVVLAEALAMLKEQPEPSEFTKRVREAHGFTFRTENMGLLKSRDIRWLKESCDIIDSLTAELKEKDGEIERLKKELKSKT